MNIPSTLRIAATVIFVAGASVAGAQLSSRSVNGGLFNSLVDWNPAIEQGLAGVGDVRMSPWAPTRIQLGTVRPADPNRPWMGYWGHYQDREMSSIVGAQHSLQASPIALLNSTNRRVEMFVPDAPAGGATAGNVVTDEIAPGAGNGNGAIFQPAVPGDIPPLVWSNSDVNVIINPEPSVYWLAAVGLVLIALIRRYRMA